MWTGQGIGDPAVAVFGSFCTTFQGCHLLWAAPSNRNDEMKIGTVVGHEVISESQTSVHWCVYFSGDVGYFVVWFLGGVRGGWI